MRTLPYIFGAAVLLLPAVARAEFQISGYGGVNTANSSDLTIHSPLVNGTYDIDWFGASFEPPPYWGLRGTWWLNDFNLPHWGVAIDYTHSKAKADLDDPVVGASFSHLEFTDGLNTVTVNGLYRWPFNDRFGVYGGFGVGASIPHVEVDTIPAQDETWNYQLAGPSVEGLVGGSVKLGYGFSLFGEYKANYSWNHAELEGGGDLETNILTHQFAIGISYSFGAPPQY